MPRTWWKSVDRWTEDPKGRMPDRMWPRYRWGRGPIVALTGFWVFWASWAWWRAEGWSYRWLYAPLLVLILLNGWWRWRLDVTDERSSQRGCDDGSGRDAPRAEVTDGP